MIDFLLNPDGFFELDENQNLKMVSGHAEVLQACSTLIRTFAREWWLDPAVGIDYDRRFLQRTFSPAQASAELRRKLGNVRGVRRIVSLDLSTSADRSVITVQASILTVYQPDPETLDITEDLSE